MDKYKHIIEMENIRVSQEKTLKKLDEVLKELEDKHKDYQALVKYYYSDKRYEDIEDDQKGLIPDDIRRGVLSEDEIYDLMMRFQENSISMIEIALKFLKFE